MFHFTNFLVNNQREKMNSIYTYETVDKLVCILHQKNTGVKIVFIFLDS